MAHLTDSFENLWHDHPGARWLIPMMAFVVLSVVSLVVILVYPQITAG